MTPGVSSLLLRIKVVSRPLLATGLHLAVAFVLSGGGAAEDGGRVSRRGSGVFSAALCWSWTNDAGRRAGSWVVGQDCQ